MIKLIQLNIFGGAVQDHLIKFFSKQNADILMLQEVVSSPSGETYYFDALQKMETHLNLPHMFYSPTWETLFSGRSIYFGNAILSRYELLNQYQRFVSQQYQKDFDFNVHSHNIRNFQHAQIELGGKKVHLINHHGYRAGKIGDENTVKICQEITDYISELDSPVILAGDFNLAPTSPSLEPLNAKLRNLCTEYKVETTRNQIARNMITVDYIWVSEGINVSHFEVLPDLVSDHAALLLEFDLN